VHKPHKQNNNIEDRHYDGGVEFPQFLRLHSTESINVLCSGFGTIGRAFAYIDIIGLRFTRKLVELQIGKLGQSAGIRTIPNIETALDGISLV
jgi:hypothetical protein